MYVLAPNQSVEKYPYTIGQLRRDNPNTSFPRNPSSETLAHFGVYPVTRKDRPEHDDITQTVTEDQPKFVSGKWQQAWTVSDASAEQVEQRKAQRRQAINDERDRRLAGDFTFADAQFQRDAVSVQRITGAATLAGFAVANGAQPGNLRWHGGDTDFAWIASDNTLVTMDAQTCLQFGQACANVETRLIFAAKALREMEPIPRDFADDGYWPDA